MKSEIVGLIQEIITEKGGVFTTLFGSEESQKHYELNINWIFNKSELEESINIVLEHIMSQVLQSYNADKYEPLKYFVDGKYKVIVFDGKQTVNRFLPVNYEIADIDTRFADLENYLEDIEVTENGQHVYFKWKFPIYDIQKNILNTF
jgi:hypothetical protein